MRERDNDIVRSGTSVTVLDVASEVDWVIVDAAETVNDVTFVRVGSVDRDVVILLADTVMLAEGRVTVSCGENVKCAVLESVRVRGGISVCVTVNDADLDTVDEDEKLRLFLPSRSRVCVRTIEVDNIALLEKDSFAGDTVTWADKDHKEERLLLTTTSLTVKSAVADWATEKEWESVSVHLTVTGLDSVCAPTQKKFDRIDTSTSPVWARYETLVVALCLSTFGSQ